MSILAKIVNGITLMSEVKIRYKDGKEIKTYTVQPHLLGKFKTTQNIVLSAYDITDSAKSSWKSFLVQNILSVDFTDESFDCTAPNYNPLDSRMAIIICSIPTVV